MNSLSQWEEGKEKRTFDECWCSHTLPRALLAAHSFGPGSEQISPLSKRQTYIQIEMPPGSLKFHVAQRIHRLELKKAKKIARLLANLILIM